MFEHLRRLYAAGKLTEGQLDDAVGRAWITPEQASIIRGEHER